MRLKKIFNNPGFAVFYMFLVMGAVLLLQIHKGDIVIWINEKHNGFLDLFFRYWTFLGDGLVFAILIFIYLLINYFRAIVFTIAAISQTIVIQLLKRIFFEDMLRPRFLMENFSDLQQVQGVDIHTFSSFPSGHTATAFTVAILLSLFSRNAYITGLLIILAALVGISRIYLLQHFFVDVYFGALLGFLNGVIVWTWMESSPICRNPAFNKGLIRK